MVAKFLEKISQNFSSLLADISPLPSNSPKSLCKVANETCRYTKYDGDTQTVLDRP